MPALNQSSYYGIIINRGRAAASGYSSPFVCLFVCLFVIYEPAHLDAIALRLQHG